MPLASAAMVAGRGVSDGDGESIAARITRSEIELL